jgi:hypothetical protein
MGIFRSSTNISGSSDPKKPSNYTFPQFIEKKMKFLLADNQTFTFYFKWVATKRLRI